MTLIGSPNLPLLEEGIKTVSAAGTAVQLTSIKGKRAYIQALEENADKKIVVGDSTVDGTASPPTGRCMLYASQSQIFEEKDTSQIYIDADQSGAKVRYAIFG